MLLILGEHARAILILGPNYPKFSLFTKSDKLLPLLFLEGLHH